MKKLLLIIPALIILSGCDASGGRDLPTPSANILDAGANPDKVDCSKMPWKENQKFCGPEHQIAR